MGLDLDGISSYEGYSGGVGRSESSPPAPEVSSPEPEQPQPSMAQDSAPAGPAGRDSALSLDDLPTGTEWPQMSAEASPTMSADATPAPAPQPSQGSGVAEGISTVRSGLDATKTTSTAARLAGEYLAEAESLAARTLSATGSTLARVTPLAGGFVAVDSSIKGYDAYQRGSYYDTIAHGLQAGGGALVAGGAISSATGVGASWGVPAMGVGGAMMIAGTAMEWGKWGYNKLAGLWH